MKIEELVKTYRLINDPKAPNWSVKFVGALVLAIAAVAAVVVGVALTHAHESAQGANVAFFSTHSNADGSRTDYVGYAQSTFDPALGASGETVQGMLADWKAQHAGAKLLEVQPVDVDGALMGYLVTYR